MVAHGEFLEQHLFQVQSECMIRYEVDLPSMAPRTRTNASKSGLNNVRLPGDFFVTCKIQNFKFESVKIGNFNYS